MWPNPQFPADLVTFTGEIFKGKFRFFCSEMFDSLLSTFLQPFIREQNWRKKALSWSYIWLTEA